MPVRTDQVEDIQQPVVSRVSAGSQKDRRYIYNGEPSRTAGAYVLRANRRGTRRKVSTFNIIMLLFGLGLAIVLYVNNIIVINRLSGDIGRLQARYEELQDQNATLAADVNKKAAWERIGAVAGEEIGLRHPVEPPGWIEVDQEKLDALKSR
jgi:hypothetical protein